MKSKRTVVFILWVVVALSFANPRSLSARRVDETVLEVDLAGRLESMLEKLIGKERSLVKVDVELSEPLGDVTPSLDAYMRNLPGVVLPDKQERQEVAVSAAPTIQRLSVVVYVDNKLSQDKIDVVKQKIPEWLELDFQRGDSFKIEPIPWKNVAPEDTALKQLRFIIVVAAVLFGLLGLVGFVWWKMKKPLRLALKKKIEEVQKKEETGQPTDMLKDIRDILAKSASMSPQRMDTLLEDIKEILAEFPNKSDAILEEIRDTLDTISSKQGGEGDAAGGAGSSEFLMGLRDAISSAVGGAVAGGGPDQSPEVVDILNKIEGTLEDGLGTRNDGDVIDEPFKYLNTCSAKEINMLVESEDARLAAIILAHIDAVKSAEVLQMCPIERQVEVSTAMATLVEDDSVAQEVKEFLQRKLKDIKLYTDFTPVIGGKAVADILSTLPYKLTSEIIEKLERGNPRLLREIRKYLFLFEDIPSLDDKDVQEVLKSVDRDRLVLALSRASGEVREKFYANMTERMVAMVKEEVTALLPQGAADHERQVVMFEDVVMLDNKTLEEVFRTVDRDTLKMALKGTAEEIRQKVYAMMTERGAAMLKEDLDVMPAIARGKCEEAQQSILDTIKKLEERPLVAQHEILAIVSQLEKAGRITSATSGKEEMV